MVTYIKNILDAQLERIILIVSIVEPLSTIPQVVQIWQTKDASSISLTTWILYTFVAVIWLLYGMKHKLKPVVISSALWIVFELLVVAGKLIYG